MTFGVSSLQTDRVGVADDHCDIGSECGADADVDAGAAAAAAAADDGDVVILLVVILMVSHDIWQLFRTP